MKARLFKVTIGRCSVACFADDEREALERACEVLNEQYDAALDPDTVFADVFAIDPSLIEFNEEVFG